MGRGWGKGSCQCGAMGEKEEVRRGCPRRSAGPAPPRRASAVLRTAPGKALPPDNPDFNERVGAVQVFRPREGGSFSPSAHELLGGRTQVFRGCAKAAHPLKHWRRLAFHTQLCGDKWWPGREGWRLVPGTVLAFRVPEVDTSYTRAAGQPSADKSLLKKNADTGQSAGWWWGVPPHWGAGGNNKVQVLGRG